MEKKAVGRSVFISACKKSSVGVLREQSEQYPIFPSYKEDKMADNYDGMAVGVFELDNLVACFVALDAASKAANVKIQSVERNRLKSGACVKMRGSVSDVNAAMEVALETAKPLGKIVSHTVIASPTADTETALKMTINKYNMSGGNEKMSYGALGLVEVVGSCNAVVVLDQMLKTSDVEFRTWHTKCGGHATIFLSGDIAAVKAAVDAVKGNPPCEIIAAAVISAPSEETSRLVKEEEEKHHK